MNMIGKLVILAFFGSIGMTLLVVGCATKDNWYPFFVIIFYIMSPIPILLSRRYNAAGLGGGVTSACQELAIFITIGIIISSFGLPIILARHPESAVISAGACWFTMGANVIVFLTILGFFVTFGNEEMDYSMW
jgi:hypothetical protein